MIQPEIGVLGLGYLAQMLFQNFCWNASSWATTLRGKTSQKGFPFKVKPSHFDWADKSTWQDLPLSIPNLVITIPPILQDCDQEEERIERWCQWLKGRQQNIGKIIYISSTGVYPNQDGWWKEDVEVEPDTLKGQLRLLTEKVLKRNFNTRVIRSGAIYGPHRHIGLKILQQSPIPNGDQPIHRIHVHDLANIVKQAIIQDDFPPVVNAVDLKPETTLTVAKWILDQNYPGYSDNDKLQLKAHFVTRKHAIQSPNRMISNDCLIKQGRYQFLFPTYQEGLKQAITE